MGGHYGVPLERSSYLELPPHAESCTPDTFSRWLETYGRGRRLALDLFSGAGGLSLGLERAGWTVAAAVDFDKRALETHTHNFPGMSLHMDLGDPVERDRLVAMMEPAKIDLVAGGPPCQPFSRAGLSKIRSLVRDHGRDEHDRRRELWVSYLDVALRLKPRAILMENVPDMGLSDDFIVIRTIEETLERAGYATQVRLVDAWAYGVPQHRKRLILLARNDVDRFTWREPVKQRTSLRDAIGDLPPIPDGEIGGRVTRYKQPQGISKFAKEMREEAPPGKVWDHMTRHVRADDREIFAGMDSRTLYKDIPKHLQRYDTVHFTDKYKKLGWDDLSRTITAHIAKDGYWYIHPQQLRTLTVREAARVQTFPDRFRFAGTRSDAFRQIGNAVPPMLGQAAAEVLGPDPDVVAPADGLKAYWLDVRNDLAAWAQRQCESGAWYQFPKLSPQQAAVAAVFSATRSPLSPATADALTLIGDATRLDRRTFVKVLALAPTARVRAALERLTPLLGSSKVWGEPESIPAKVGFKPGESQLYQLLTDRPLLLVGQGPIRVAARVAGSTADRINRLSDGRVDLARLVGAGDEAPLRMAAVRYIGMTVCRESHPICTDCPLKAYCVSRADTLEEAEPDGG